MRELTCQRKENIVFQTQSLIGKVRDVTDTFMQTVLAAGNTTGRDMNDPAMNVLMKKATNLASVLTTLMRSLRVFNWIQQASTFIAFHVLALDV